jgi:hypothetical protein
MTKKTITWWVGWVALWPIRVLFCIFMSIIFASFPSGFYGWFNSRLEDNQDNWKL